MRLLCTLGLSLAILIPALVYAADTTDLVAKLKDADSGVRRQAARDLGELGVEARSAAPALIKSLRDKDSYVRRYAVMALAKVAPEGKAGKEAISGMFRLTNDPREEVQLAAIEALASVGHPALDALVSTLKDSSKNPKVRKRAAQAIGEIGLSARRAVPVLTSIVSGKVRRGKKGKMADDNDLRPDAATALGRVAKKEDKEAIAALRAAAEAKRRSPLKKAAAASLYKLTGERVKKKKKK